MRRSYLVTVESGVLVETERETFATRLGVELEAIAGPFQLDAGAVEFLRAANGKKLPAPALRVITGLATQWEPLRGDVWNLDVVGRRDPEEW